MNFKEYRKRCNEDANYNPQVFEDEINGEVPASQETASVEQTSDIPTPQQKSAMGDLIERYFKKGQNDAIASLDGFSNDFVNELNAFINEEWVNKNEFVGRDDLFQNYQKAVKTLTDSTIVKIGTAIHDLGVNLQNTKNKSGAKKAE